MIAAVVLGCIACGDDTTPIDDGGTVCTTNAECSDSITCNGEEQCMPGAVAADERGCIPGSFPCEDGEMCNEDTGECTPGCAGDEDGDGFEAIACGGDDCDDTNANRYPGNTEICDEEGVDEDCDPATLGDDMDGDGFVSLLCCNTQPGGDLRCGEDCDDSLVGVGPGQVDDCNGADDDCDGNTDEDPTFTFYRDVDGDNSGDPDVTVMACSRPEGFASDAGDCNDMDEQINPGATERCQEMLIDDNCNGTANEGCSCTTGDMQTCGPPEGNTGNCMTADQACVDGSWPATCSGAVYPSTEVCDGGDEDCDGMIDEAGAADAFTIYRDMDGDGYGVTAVTMQSCTVLSGWTTTPGDCDDDAVLVRPGVADVCDGIDNDCDMNADPGCDCTNGMTQACPAGLDETGDCEQGTQTCTGGVWGDCIGETLPGNEVCGGGDEDCDGTTDESGATDAQTYYADGDGDMYGDPAVSQVACSLGSGWVLNSGDCNDAASSINPLANEVCDGIDNNCADGIDENPEATTNSCGGLPPMTTATCASAMCTITGCPTGFDDCLNGFSDFCETNLTNTLDRCGDCGTSCTFDCEASACNDLVSLEAGGTHTCGVTEQGDIACWGANGSGQLGNSTTSPSASPVLVSTIADAEHVATGESHTCAIRTSGRVFCWGDADRGKIGQADTATDLSAPTAAAATFSDAIHIAAGQDHTCVVRMMNGWVECFGAGHTGQLGSGAESDSHGPQRVRITTFSDPVVNAVEVAAGAQFSCARTSGGSVHCWGVNDLGQLGDGVADHTDECELISTPFVVTGDCSTRAVLVSSLTTATQIAAGAGHACALRSNGTVVCWGDNSRGQLGSSGAGAASNVPVPVDSLTDAVEVAAGLGFSCARRMGGQVLCWGWGADGRLGTGDTMDQAAPTPVTGLSASHLGRLAGGHGCALDPTGAAYCWGNNDSGRLGDGTMAPSSSPVPVNSL